MAYTSSHRNFALVFLSLLSLTTFAIAQSVYQAIVGNREFVVLNQVTHADLWLIILFFNVVPAAVLALLWLAARKLSADNAPIILSASFFLLLIPFLLELHKRYLSIPLAFRHNTVLVVIPLAILAWIVFRYRGEFERFLLVLSPVILIFPALFLYHAWNEVSPMTVPTASSKAEFARDASGRTLPPIFLLVLDELTRPALLDGNGNIDATRFPHFAELARHSTWFTDATANAEYTTRSIPVIVTGNFPHGNEPSDSAYPDNLFRLLAPDYDITIHEAVTRFCVPRGYRCPDADRVQERGHLLDAVFKLYLLRIAPKSVVMKLEADDLRTEQQRFEEFLGEIDAPGTKPVFQFMHLELPHAPYMLTADGAIHEETPGGFDPTFAGDAALLQHLRDNYERQIEYVDRELGRFMDKLKQTGLWERSLIIVTSDHGVSWTRQAPGRVLTDTNAELIFPVPLFIKLPDQKEGTVSALDAQLIDIAPTIAAIIDLKIPWQTAGHNLFGAGAPAREKIMIDANGRKFARPSDFAATNPTGGD